MDSQAWNSIQNMMDLIQENYKEEFMNDNEKCSAENSEENSSPDDDLEETNGIDGEPAISPRIGDQYQTEIPPLLSEEDRNHMYDTTTNNDGMNADDLYLGKYIPIIWCRKDKISSNTSVKKSLDSDCKLPEHSEYKCMEYVKKDDWIPLPDLPKSPWSDSESQNLVLGLYVYGKNLVKVQKFVETKTMGDVLTLYYGKFYNSEAQCKWVEWRKDKRRKRIIGYRIFTGVRQQEILARLLPNRTQYIQDRLHELMRAFNEEMISLEVLLFTLKDIIGIAAIVEAVGIGKGKQDLTRILHEPCKSNQAIRARADLPAGKSWSSLTPDEIVNYLTGDHRLSKARSSDLFWEAVWPRLLARGWHSEQPSDVTSLACKHSLVFLIPGVKKFSRKKLSKGSHYFDSISDVLNKVASDPRLIDLDSLAQDPENEPEFPHNDESGFKKTSYLQPRVQGNTSESMMKFTIVDTALLLTGKSTKTRELRSLPINASKKRSSREISSNSSSTDRSNSTDLSLNSANEQNLAAAAEKPAKGLKAKSKPKSNSAPKRLRLTSCSSSVSLSIQSTNNSVEAVAIYQQPPPPPPQATPPRSFIDLNLRPQDFEAEEATATEMDVDVVAPAQGPSESNTVLNSDSNNGRRHGTRNRPPTTKALEALESGFFHELNEKGMKSSRPRTTNSRTSRSRPRKNIAGSGGVVKGNVVGECSGGSTSLVGSSWFDGSRAQGMSNV